MEGSNKDLNEESLQAREKLDPGKIYHFNRSDEII